MSPRACPAFAILALVTLAAPALPAADEPEIRGRKASEWAEMLGSDKNARHREGAVLALGLIGTKSKLVVPALSKAVRTDAEPTVRRRAANTLGQIGRDARDAVEDLAEALKQDKDASVREAIAGVLGRLGDSARPALPVLTATLKDPAPDVRAAAAEALGKLGVEGRVSEDSELPAALKETVPALRGLLKDGESGVRKMAVFALGRVDAEPSAEVVAELAERMLKDAAADVQKTAAEALWLLGPAAKDAAEPLGQALAAKDSRTELRQQAVLALGKLKADAKPALPQLKAALKDPDRSVRHHAIAAIGGIGDEVRREALPEFVRLLEKDGDVEVRLAAIAELVQLGADAKEAVPALEAATRDPRASVREAASNALKKIRE